MTLVQKQNDAWVELPVGSPVTYNDIVASWGTVEIWSEQEKNDFGVYTLIEQPQDAPGKIIVPTEISTNDQGRPYRIYKYLTPDPVQPQPYYIPTYLLRQRAEKIGIWSDLSDYLVQYPALMLKTLTLQTGVDPKDADLIDGLNSLQVPQSVQDYLLSDPSLGV